MRKTYTELLALPSFEQRFNYLKIGGKIGEQSFGGNRYLNQAFYRSAEWKYARDRAIARDLGCDLGIEGCEIFNHLVVHHLNPISLEDIRNRSNALFDLENLICCTDATHKAIHYGSDSFLQTTLIERTPYDTCPWKRGLYE